MKHYWSTPGCNTNLFPKQHYVVESNHFKIMYLSLRPLLNSIMRLIKGKKHKIGIYPFHDLSYTPKRCRIKASAHQQLNWLSLIDINIIIRLFKTKKYARFLKHLKIKLFLIFLQQQHQPTHSYFPESDTLIYSLATITV